MVLLNEFLVFWSWGCYNDVFCTCLHFGTWTKPKQHFKPWVKTVLPLLLDWVALVPCAPNFNGWTWYHPGGLATLQDWMTECVFFLETFPKEWHNNNIIYNHVDAAVPGIVHWYQLLAGQGALCCQWRVWQRHGFLMTMFFEFLQCILKTRVFGVDMTPLLTTCAAPEPHASFACSVVLKELRDMNDVDMKFMIWIWYQIYCMDWIQIQMMETNGAVQNCWVLKHVHVGGFPALHFTLRQGIAESSLPPETRLFFEFQSFRIWKSSLRLWGDQVDSDSCVVHFLHFWKAEHCAKQCTCTSWTDLIVRSSWLLIHMNLLHLDVSGHIMIWSDSFIISGCEWFFQGHAEIAKNYPWNAFWFQTAFHLHIDLLKMFHQNGKHMMS